MLLLPGVLAYCQGFVIHPSARIQRLPKQCALVFGRAKAKLKGFPHRTIVLLIYAAYHLRNSAKADQAFHPLPLKRRGFHGLKPIRCKKAGAFSPPPLDLEPPFGDITDNMRKRTAEAGDIERVRFAGISHGES